VVIPEIGMAFESEENAYDMYNTYAGKVGFSIKSMIQSVEQIKVYIPRFSHAAIKDLQIIVHHKPLQEQVVVPAFNLVSAEREFGQCKRLNLNTTII
jgi:hypothetical protein